MTATHATETRPLVADQVTAALGRLTAHFGPIQRLAASKLGINGVFPTTMPIAVAALKARFEDAGASVSFSGIVPQLISGQIASPLIAGTIDGVAFTARCRSVSTDAHEIELHLSAHDPAASSDGGKAMGLFLLCDEILGGDRAKPELIAGYLNHRLATMRGKGRARLIAECAALVAEHLHEQA